MNASRQNKKTFKHFAKKHLGQNFLVDENAKQRIINACGLTADDLVLEIGPGLGALTTEITKRTKHLYAIETDEGLYQQLLSQCADQPITLIHADFLNYDLAKLPLPLKAIGNLPYNISTPIIEKLLLNRNHFRDAYLTVQLEFGKRLAAKPNSKDYGALSCFVQYTCDVKILLKIKNTSFRPIPKVTSCLVKLTFRDPVDKAEDENFFFKIIRLAFKQRRKQIINALSSVIEKDKLGRIFKNLGLKETLRAENLGIKNYIDLAREMKPSTLPDVRLPVGQANIGVSR